MVVGPGAVVVVLAVVVDEGELFDDDEQAPSTIEVTARAATMPVSRWRVVIVNRKQVGGGQRW